LAEKLAKESTRGSDFSAAFPSTRRFVCVLDEAQVLGTQMRDMFMSAQVGHSSLRPLLSPVLSGVRSALGVSPIVSGTGLSLVKEWKSITSGVAARVQAKEFVFTDFRALTADEVEAVLSSYLDVTGQTRLREAAEWLSGRPRFVATFVEEVISGDTTVDAHLDVYRDAMLAEGPSASRHPPRTVGSMWARLRTLERAEIEAMGTTVRNPYDAALVDAYWVSRGVHVVRPDNPALIEFGIGYPRVVEQEPYVTGDVTFEPLVLEAAARCRARLAEPEFVEPFRRSSGLTQDIAGKYLEYAVGDALFPGLVPADAGLETSALLSGVAVPPALWGKWERPVRWCGRVAYTGGDLYAWLDLALKPTWNGARIMYPDNLAGPDIVAVLRDSTHKRVVVVFVQVKFEKRVDADAAVLTLDPAKLHTVNRGAAPGAGKGQEHAMKKFDAKRKALLAKLSGGRTGSGGAAAAVVPVLRVLVSGKSRVEDVGSDVVPSTGRGDQDLLLVLDEAKLTQVLGKDLARVVSEVSGG